MAFSVAAPLCLAAAGARGQEAQPVGRVRPGDRIMLKVLMDTVFADTVRVGADGRAVLPRIGAVSFGDVPYIALGDSVRRAYARVFTVPAVEAIPLVRVTALGEMRRPGVYFVEPGTDLRDLVARAGGLTDIARDQRITVIRGDSAHRIAHWERPGAGQVRLAAGDAVLAERESWLRRNTFSLLSGAGVIASVIVGLTR